jgi:hypothetical protein
MAKTPALEPRWLVGLLNLWAVRSLHSQTKGLGYYTENPMLKDGIRGQCRSYEPTGYSDVDYLDADAAINELDLMRRLAVMRYFKPWARANIDAEMQRDDGTWLYHLRRALDILARELDRKREQAEWAATLDLAAVEMAAPKKTAEEAT